MDKNQKPEDSITQAESLGIFNTYSVEVRSKIDGLVKQVLFISAGVQAITIGAFLSGNPPQLPINAVYLLKCGWFALSISIVLSLCFMLGQVLAMIAVGLRFKSKLESGRKSAELLMAPMPMRIFNWVVGFGAFASCAFGSMALSLAAMRLVGSLGGA
jgi:uncharacterized membrane protein YciS (DUF1049 family)